MPTFHNPRSEHVYMTGTQYSHGISPSSIEDEEVSYTISLSAKRLQFLSFIQLPSLNDTDPSRFGVVLNIKRWNGRKEVTTLSLDLRPHKIIINKLDYQSQLVSSYTHIIPEGEIPTSTPFPYRLA